MRVSELIQKLQAIAEEAGGDPDVLITDGFKCECYRGDYAVEVFVDLDGYTFVDIGIGGLQD